MVLLVAFAVVALAAGAGYLAWQKKAAPTVKAPGDGTVAVGNGGLDIGVQKVENGNSIVANQNLSDDAG